MRKNGFICVLGAALVTVSAIAQEGSSAPPGTWVKKYEGKPVSQLLPLSAQIVVAVAGDSLLTSADGGDNWQPILTEAKAQLRGVFMFDSQNGWVVGSPGVILKLEKQPNGMVVNRLQNPPPGDLQSIFFRDAEHGWVGGANGVLLSTRDAGKTWSSRTFQPQAGEAAAQIVRKITFLSETQGAALFGTNQVIISDNGGEQWRPATFPKGTVLETMARQGQTLWVGGGRQLTPTLVVAGLWRSDDAGKSWKAVSLGDVLGAVTGVWFADANTGFVAAGGKVYMTEDGGQTWKEISDGRVAIEKIAGADTNTLWGIAGGGIYRLTLPTP
ncbi:MAG TPA: YCF48-related protein [Candidatus Xenobia bacterium]|nr:YCF48-related protein [Candidatus Xenobia bacterium]